MNHRATWRTWKWISRRLSTDKEWWGRIWYVRASTHSQIQCNSKQIYFHFIGERVNLNCLLFWSVFESKSVGGVTPGLHLAFLECIIRRERKNVINYRMCYLWRDAGENHWQMAKLAGMHDRMGKHFWRECESELFSSFDVQKWTTGVSTINQINNCCT